MSTNNWLFFTSHKAAKNTKYHKEENIFPQKKTSAQEIKD
jgi:hypothetical protein